MRTPQQKIPAFIMFLALALNSASSWALPPQAEADKLLIEAKTAMDAKNYSVAAEKFARIDSLKVKVPDSFAYHYGISLMNTGEFKRAKQQLDRYITNAGSNAKFYKEALKAFTETEQKEAAVARQAENERQARLQSIEKYKRDLAEYEKEKAEYPGKRLEAENQSKECLARSSSDLEDCSSMAKQKYGGFFGDSDKYERQSKYCWELHEKSESRCHAYINRITMPIEPKKPE